MEDHYKTLGLNSSATHDEIRRAYRVLARRYHPDVNPGRDSNEKFKEIAAAYKILSDAELKKKYDSEYDQANEKLAQQRLKSYAKQARERFEATHKARMAEAARKKQEAFGNQRKAQPKKSSVTTTAPKNIINKIQEVLGKPLNLSLPWKKQSSDSSVKGLGSISLIEVSLTVPDAIQGIKKTIEIPYQNQNRKISVNIPSGVRSGSVIRMRSKSFPGEELVLIVQLASHPLLAMERRGLVVQLPITLSESIHGAQIQVPTLDEPCLLKIPAGSQSGAYLRLKDRGVVERDGRRGDIFYRLLIQSPKAKDASGLSKKILEIEPYYDGSIRSELPEKLV